MSKKLFKKTLVVGMIAAISLSCFTGCNKKADSNTIETNSNLEHDDDNVISNNLSLVTSDDLSTDTDAYKFAVEQSPYSETEIEDIKSEFVSEKDYSKDVENVVMNISNSDTKDSYVLSYNGVDLSYPFDISAFENDGWTCSADSLVSDNIGVSNSMSFENAKYGESIIRLSSYKESLNSIHSGLYRNIKDYGIFELCVPYYNADEVSPDFKLNGVSILGSNIDSFLQETNVQKDLVVPMSDFSNTDISVVFKSSSFDDTSFATLIHFVTQDNKIVSFYLIQEILSE